MTHDIPPDEFGSHLQLIEFAGYVAELASHAEVRFRPPDSALGLVVESVDLLGHGLLLQLEDLGEFLLPMAEIESKSFYIQRDRNAEVIPPWLIAI